MDIKEEVADLSEKLRAYQKAYYVDSHPLVSDQEYDRLFDRLVQLETAFPELKSLDSPTVRVGSDLTSDFPEVTHTIPVLSLDKAYSAEAILSWDENQVSSPHALLWRRVMSISALFLRIRLTLTDRTDCWRI